VNYRRGYFVAASLLPSTCCYGAWGIYTDQGSSNIVIENNVVYHVDYGGYVHHFGRYNTVRNNIFALGKSAEVMFTGPEDHLSFRLERNIVL
jgi:parallel beta-helix repeat protein